MRLHRLFALSSFAVIPCLVAVPTASAQTAPPREAAAAASRAAREADNPMRVIIEASKLKVRIKPDGDGSDSSSGEKRVVRAPAPRPAAPASVTKASGVPAAETPVLASKPVPEPPSMPAQTVARAADSMPTALTTPPPILPAPKPSAQAPVPLKLAQLVEPSVPDSTLRRMRNDVQVMVGFTVNPDGSVSDVVIKSNPMKSLDSAILEAVGQWRYNPIGESRTHAVQLVLRANH